MSQLIYTKKTKEHDTSTDDYSAEETVIGTWIDGKPIYRKVIVLPQYVNLPVNAWQNITNVSSLSINYLLNAIAYTDETWVWTGFLTRIINGNLDVYNGITSWNIKTLVIEYTKTTD